MVQNTPLKGHVIAITRPAGQAEEAAELIRAKGGIPYYIPAIEIKGVINPEPIKKFITELSDGKVDYVILMSTNGVKYLFAATDELKLTNQLREGLKRSHVIAVGPKTAEAIQDYQVHVDMIPQKYSSEGLLETLKYINIRGKIIRIPRTCNASPTLTDQLRARGAEVQEIYVYESGLPKDENAKKKFYDDLVQGRINAILFGSGLSAKNIFKMLIEKTTIEQLQKMLATKVTIVAIGPTTAEALHDLNVKVDVMPADYLFDKALDALSEYWRLTKNRSIC